MKHLLSGASFSALLLVSGACANNAQLDENATAAETTLPEGVGINLAYVDSTVSPTEDFFQFVNGKWIETTEIPGDQGRWGSFQELREQNNKILLDVLQTAAASNKYPAGSDERKAAEFYRIGMDSLRAEQQGLAPLKAQLDKIQAINDKNALQSYLVQDDKQGIGNFFGLWVGPDEKNSSKNIVNLYAGGLGLPERDYYLSQDAKSKEIRQKYVAFVADMLKKSGVANPEEKAKTVMAIETELANSMLSKEDRRDPYKTYNKMSVAKLQQLAPAIDWKAYFSGLGATGVDSVNVMQTAYMDQLGKTLSKRSLDELKAYLTWHQISDAAPYLNSEFVQSNFDFYSNYLRGIAENSPRWKRVLGEADDAVGEAIGKLYVADAFPPEAKEKAQEMVDNIKLAFADRIKGLEWMSDSTKERALEKLNSFTVKIGYPDKWRDYSALNLNTGAEASYYENVLNGREFQFEYMMDKLGQPVDRTEWGMTPQTVNAYYNPGFNEIVFPAGILQPPFYDYRADAAVNYGGIGAVIGHEISHGFDDQGSQYDAEGNLKNWWTDKDLELFNQRTGKLAAQYDAYQPLDSVFVNGQFTLGENIGDLGGLNVAYDGLQRHLDQQGHPGKIDGLTPEQRFFMSWATIWRTKYRPEYLRTQVLTDPHSPAMYRGNGPLVNMPAFYEAFNVKEGDDMWRAEDERVKIW